jgi:asparagine synthase (glutamine-hydrolysing)
MCGIAGWIDPNASSDRASLESIAAAMADALSHRGPDDSGVWADPEAGVALGHRRLSIVDLSSAGHQPMRSAAGRFVISYNGEIYNSAEIRAELESADPNLRLRGHSDTEILLAAFERWGVEPSLKRANGMFAFALWDARERELVLARDRFGEKPLYYGFSNGVFLFASELKAIRAHPSFTGSIDQEALARFLQFSCVPAPHSIYRGIRKLPPGTILRYHAGKTRITPFWSTRACVEAGVSRPFLGSEADAIAELDSLLRDAVRLRMQADVPLGAFLSGGIDSSLTVALMQQQSELPVRSFSIGFEDAAYDEAGDARAVAHHLGTEHTELYVQPADAIDLIARLPEVYDEPFADSSQIPTILVSRLARQHVKVSLSGDGGDEVFGGYNRYIWGGRLWDLMRVTPRTLRHASARVIQSLSAERWQQLFDRMRPVLPAFLSQRTPGYKLHRLAGLLSSSNPEEMYVRMASHWLPSAHAVREIEASSASLGNDTDSYNSDCLGSCAWLPLPGFALQAMYADTITYLPNDILTKLDRATMAFGLEGRIPYLDHRVVEFAWRLPLSMKVRPNCGKWILRQLLQLYVPERLVERPKMGFAVPLETWLRTSMRDWAEAMLDPKRLREEGFFDAALVREKWSDHLRGRGIWQTHLWSVLMFQSWLAHQSQQPRISKPVPSLASA